MVQKIQNTSDERTANNVVRHEYRTLSEVEKRQMKEVKDLAASFIEKLHDLGGRQPRVSNGLCQASRELSIAQTKIEEAAMWAVKHITQ